MGSRAESGPLQLVIVLVSSVAWAADPCPPRVSEAASKVAPGASIVSCKRERERGKIQFAVKLKAASSKVLELDITPEGVVLLIEEPVSVDAVPAPVRAGFALKFPNTKPHQAERQTHLDGAVTYELAFVEGGRKHEATFSAQGAFVDQE
jgi:hypothetical protein